MHCRARLFTLPLILTVLAGLLLPRPAAADQVVYFVNGKAITVKKVERGDRLTILEIDGGGRIGVPTAQIDRIEELQLSPQSTAVVAPPAAVPPAQGALAIPPANAGQPAVATQTGTQTTGPGIGGQPVQPNSGLAGATPLRLSEAPAREGATAAPATSPGPTSAASRPVMQPGGNRQLGPRREGGISQPNVGLRRPGARSGPLRGRPMAAYQPPPAASDRRPESAPGSEPQSAVPSTPPAQDADPADDPADDPALTPDNPESEQPSGAPAADEAEPSDPPAEEEGDDPAEER